MKRNQFVDTIKAILIILVVMGHSIQYGGGAYYLNNDLYYDNYLFRAIYTFHMPMFMILSGFFFGYTNNNNLRTIICSRLKSIGIPFVAYCTILYFVWWYSNDISEFYVSDFIRKMKINMWFLSSVLVNSLIVAIGYYLLKSYSSLLLIFIFFLLFFIPDEKVYAPHKYMYLFFVVGYWLNDRHGVKDAINRWIDNKWLVLLLLISFVLIVYSYDECMFIYKGGFCIMTGFGIDYNMLFLDVLRFIEGFICCLFFLSIMKKYHILLNNFHLGFLGKNTLGLYGFQCVLFALLNELHCPALISINHARPFCMFAVVMILSVSLVWLCSNNNLLSMLFLGKIRR